jgi:hypothetical protein
MYCIGTVSRLRLRGLNLVCIMLGLSSFESFLISLFPEQNILTRTLGIAKENRTRLHHDLFSSQNLTILGERYTLHYVYSCTHSNRIKVANVLWPDGPYPPHQRRYRPP